MSHVFSPAVLACILVPLVRLWGRTLRIRQVNEAVLTGPLWSRRPVALLWHDEIFPLIPNYEGLGMVCVVSQSRDGELLARVLERLGFLTARGSSSRGGLRALLGARRLMDEHGVGAIFTVDGPRGPRHKVKPGAAFLASHAGSPLVPVRVLMDRAFVFQRAWDKFQLPWPFSTCTIIYGEPLDVPADVETHMDAYCRHLEDIMHGLGHGHA